MKVRVNRQPDGSYRVTAISENDLVGHMETTGVVNRGASERADIAALVLKHKDSYEAAVMKKVTPNILAEGA